MPVVSARRPERPCASVHPGGGDVYARSDVRRTVPDAGLGEEAQRMILRDLLDPRELLGSRGVAAARPMPLLAALWLTGGLLATLAFAVSATPGTRTAGMATGLTAVAVGLALAAVRRRRFPAWVYPVLTLCGGVAITVMVAVADPVLGAAVAVLYVYVCVFSLVAVQRWPVLVPVLAALVHAAVLATSGRTGWVGAWLMVWGTGLVTGLLVAGVVSGLRAAREEQAALAAQLRASDEAKTAFLHAVHHELSRPMTAMQGLSETLAERGEQLDPDLRRDLAQRVVAQAQRMQGMLTDLLQLGSLDTGVVGSERRAVALPQVIAEALELSDVRGRQPPVQVEVADTTVRIDPARVAHAVANLLTNAAKYGAPDEPIVVAAAVTGGRVRITVEDRGPGIPPAMRERVFEPYVRAREQDRDRGTGVGLAVVRAVARLHGGDAHVEAPPGGGTRVVLDLALDPEPSDREVSPA